MTIKNHFKKESLFKKISNNNKALNYLRVLYSVPNNIEWSGYSAVPPGSFVDIVCKVFYEVTNIPLEIPFYTCLSLISAKLLENEIRIAFCDGEIIKPDIWVVILSESGSGKTYTLNHLSSIAKVKEFPECTSAARFAQELQFNNNSIWIRDEFGQFMRAIEEQGYLRELKDYFLRVFDGKEIVRSTKKEKIQIKDPALSLLGLTVGSTFLKYITLESMLDGFAQRFQYVIAKSDPKRHFSDYPIWTIGQYKPCFKEAWDKMWNVEMFNQYQFTEEATNTFKIIFKEYVDSAFPESFYRRVMSRLAKYALVYHLILGKKGQYLDAHDVEWAARLVLVQLRDAKNIIEEHSETPIEKKIKAIENLSHRYGRIPTVREVIQGINSINNVQEARSLLIISNIEAKKF